MKRPIPATLLLLAGGLVYASDQLPRFVNKFLIPGSSEIVVVAEVDFEPRSIGSYALSVYGGTSKEFPLDDFIVGLIRPRNGAVEAVRFDDLDGDKTPEIVVIMRSVGSGGYVSADAFRYESRSLQLIASVSDLDKGADPLKALREKFKMLNGRNG